MSIKQKLGSLHTQQRKLTAAKNAATDPRIKKTLELKQQMMGRRIDRYQAGQKTDQH